MLEMLRDLFKMQLWQTVMAEITGMAEITWGGDGSLWLTALPCSMPTA